MHFFKPQNPPESHSAMLKEQDTGSPPSACPHPPFPPQRPQQQTLRQSSSISNTPNSQSSAVSAHAKRSKTSDSPFAIKILGIESSCDETAAAIIADGTLRSHEIATQEIHAQYAGVVPELAARAHEQMIVSVIARTLHKAKIQLKDLNAIAVTQGPGLLGSLLVGIAFANGLGMASNLPVIGIHHTRAHLLANFIEKPHPSFPFLGLIVSGGHTQLVICRSPYDMTLLGSTLDDAIGEAFDKIARMIGIKAYPGGIYIDRYAAGGDPKRFAFPKTKVAGYDFSFSGIKTAFLYFLAKAKQQDPHFAEKHKTDLCASIQWTLIDMLVTKVIFAMEKTGLNQLVLGGGVANNSLLRERLKALSTTHGWQFFVPAKPFCTDNGAMIAMAGHYLFTQQNYKPPTNIIPIPRMAL